MSSTVATGSRRPSRAISVTTSLPVTVTLEERDATRTVLLLHGGGGPATMTAFADLLAERTHSRVLLPTHPGFAGTPRPEHLASTRELAATYIALLDALDLAGVTVLGNSFGGWLAAEIALLGSPRVRQVVLVDAVGVVAEGHPITDVRGLSLPDLQKLSFHDPRLAPRPPAGGGDGPRPDLGALAAYTGMVMADPTLAGRLGALDLPVHVVWGESDGIVDTGYGRALAAAIPGSTFTVLPRTGHLPQVETPEELLAAIIGPARL